MDVLCLEWLNKEVARLAKLYWNRDDVPGVVIDGEVVQKDIRENGIVRGDGISVVAFYVAGEKLIDINSRVVRRFRYTKGEFRGILKHELCHWHLHTIGKPYNDEDITFARELIKVRAANTCNSDKGSRDAMRKAREELNSEVFSLHESEYDMTLYLRREGRTREDFRRDLRKAYIDYYKEIVYTRKDMGIESIYDLMLKRYGYKEYKMKEVERYTFTGVGCIRSFRENLEYIGTEDDGEDIYEVEEEIEQILKEREKEMFV